jgi:quercetin dioxygenase-like cupin family protein
MILLVIAALQQAPAAPIFYASAYSDWKTGPDGVARMNLVGTDSTSPAGLSTFRLRYPASRDSTRATVHYHFGTQHILVLKGTLLVGFGETVDYAAAKEYTAGGFVVIPSGRPHYEWTRGETEIQVEAIGPTTTEPWPRRSAPAVPRPGAAPPVDSSHVRPNGLPQWSFNQGGGARMALVGSSPTSPTELQAFRMFVPNRPLLDSTRITYHYHFGTEHITVLKGILYFAIGDKVDRSKVKAYGPGSFIENPSGAKHFEWFAGEFEGHIEALGSLGAINLDQATGQPR